MKRHRFLSEWCPRSGKICYPSRRVATQAAQHAKTHRDAPPLSVYKCPDCRDFHLTSHPRQAA